MGVWAFLAAMVIAGRLIDPRIPGLPQQVTVAAIRLTLIEYAVWMLLTPPLLWFAARLTEEDQYRIWRILLAALIGLLLAIGIDALIEAMRSSVIQPPRRRRRPPPFSPLGFRRFGDLGFVDDLMIYFAVLFAGIARASTIRGRWRLRETARLQEHASQLQVQLADARLGALRAQLDPHFLFNTLNAISAMVERDPRGVRRMISRLSELLRHSLEADADELTLQRELELLDRYLDIMRVRFGERLGVVIDVSDEARQAMVPNLILQPLVENAIRYAIAPREEGGLVTVSAQREGERLVVHVRDDGPGPGANLVAPGGGVGLANARARLDELYGERQHLTLRHAEDGPGAIAEVSIPFRQGAS